MTEVYVKRVPQKTAPRITWVMPGTYELIRWFDDDRAMIRLHGGKITLVRAKYLLSDTQQ